MTILALLALAVAGWLGHLWLGARAENAQLRSQVSVLKRRLAQSRLG